jgi:hypothetical protein
MQMQVAIIFINNYLKVKRITCKNLCLYLIEKCKSKIKIKFSKIIIKNYNNLIKMFNRIINLTKEKILKVIFFY